MKLVYVSSFVLWPVRLSSAFVAPRSAYQQMPIRRTGSTTTESDQMGISEETYPSLTVTDAAPLTPSLSQKATSLSTGDGGSTLDVGKAIFLANVEENAELLKKSSLYLDLDDEAAIPSRLQLRNDTVRVILAASEEAVAKAEASFSMQISETERKALVPTSIEKPFSTPGVGKILKFAIPAIGVWLCSPMLSLIDTAAVGILSGTIQQAALNPAVAVTDYSALLIAFLYTGATNLIAAAREHDEGVDGAPRTRSTLIGALQLSSWVGLGLGLTLFTLAKPLLRTIIGNDGISPAVLDASLKYVRIRALGMPAAALIGTAQASCLGMQDIRSPLYVLLAAAVVNFMGDMCFVGCAHPWIGGAAGAAWATVFSQYAAVGLFVHWMRHKAVDKKAQLVGDDGPSPLTETTTVDLSNAILELTTGNPSKSSRRKRWFNAVKSIRAGGSSNNKIFSKATFKTKTRYTEWMILIIKMCIYHIVTRF